MKYIGREREHRIWKNMRNRCYCKSSTEYKSHGARGITVCNEWRYSFEIFFKDMGLSKGMSIDRVDNNGNYELSNCRWATAKEQSNNRRSNVLITYKEQTMTITEWSELLGLKRGTIPKRIILGWSIERIIETPSRIKPK